MEMWERLTSNFRNPIPFDIERHEFLSLMNPLPPPLPSSPHKTHSLKGRKYTTPFLTYKSNLSHSNSLFKAYIDIDNEPQHVVCRVQEGLSLDSIRKMSLSDQILSILTNGIVLY